MYPKVNQNIIIEVGDQDQSWKSIVAEVRDKEILISFPSDLSSLGQLQIGTKIEVSYTLNDNKYAFITEIIGRKTENINLLILNKPEKKDISKLQLREDFRVNVNVPLFLKDKESKIINLSGGGLLCSCSPDLELNASEVVSVTISLPNFSREKDTTISFQCEVIRVVKVLERNQVALKFLDLNERDQKKIVQFCIEKQRQLRMKELGLNSTRR
jgi:c-di-GMP-binding flagellar brake protein YcgR